MDFIFDNIYIIIVVAAGLAQWIKATKEAKRERENQQQTKQYYPKQSEERRHSRPAVPPPLPAGARNVSPRPPSLPAGANTAPPSLDRSPVPSLKKANRPTSEGKAFVNAPHYIEEAQQAELARQAAIAEQLSGLKQARKNKQEAIQTAKREKAKAVVSGSIRDRLKNHSELRQAFVLKEFLDKPLSLR